MVRFLYTALLLLMAASWHVAGRPVMLDRAAAQADLDSLSEFIREVHPDLFAICPQEKFDAEFYSYRNTLPDSVPTLKFYMEVARLTASLGDGHTSASMPPIPRMDPELPMLPLGFKIGTNDTTLRIVRPVGFPADSLPYLHGAAVESINGVPAVNLLAEMTQYASGERSFFRLERLQPLFHQMLYALHPADRYTVICRDSTGTLRSADLKTVPYKRIAADKPTQRQTGNPGNNLDYAFMELSGRTGLILYNRCRGVKPFSRFCDSVFTLIRNRGIDKLIIDVRNNGGGDSQISDTLFQYISPVPYQQFGRCEVRISDPVRKLYHKEMQMPELRHEFTSFRNAELIPLRDNELRFKGECYSLISHRTFSSASDFAWAFQYFKMGTTIGEETGGQAVCFGDIIPYTLPRSGIQVCCSFKQFWVYGATDEDRHGTQPDLKVPADTALDFTLQMLWEQRTGQAEQAGDTSTGNTSKVSAGGR